MRIRDWSSDVCSSDLIDLLAAADFHHFLGRYQHFFEKIAHALLRRGIADRLGDLLFEVRIHMDDVPARRHRQLPMPRTSCTPRRRIESTVKKNSAATRDRKSTRLNSSH